MSLWTRVRLPPIPLKLGVPQYEEIMDYSRAKLTLPIEYASDKFKASDKQAIKKRMTSDKINMILKYFEKGKKYKTSEIAHFFGLSNDRARVYLKKLVDDKQLESDGANKGKVYYLPK